MNQINLRNNETEMSDDAIKLIDSLILDGSVYEEGYYEEGIFRGCTAIKVEKLLDNEETEEYLNITDGELIKKIAKENYYGMNPIFDKEVTFNMLNNSIVFYVEYQSEER